MSDDKSKLPVNIDIGAKAEAKLEVKTEIPSESSGRFVDALTDAIRPFAERRGLKADLIRLQREEVALEIAKLAQRKANIENLEIHPVPNKVLVPLLEKGSLEELRDEVMIERWANLLTSASTGEAVQPRFVGILDELASSQAKMLEYIAFHEAQNLEFPYTSFGDSAYNYEAHYARKDVDEYASYRLGKNCELEDLFDELVGRFLSCGVYLEAMFLDVPGENDASFEYDSAHELEGNYISDLAILQSLGLIRREIIETQIVPESIAIKAINLSIYYYHLTQLGVHFCEACCRPTIERLREMQLANDRDDDKK